MCIISGFKKCLLFIQEYKINIAFMLFDRIQDQFLRISFGVLTFICGDSLQILSIKLYFMYIHNFAILENGFSLVVCLNTAKF